ncbi:carbohydrate-binding module family 20 domain-containing protein, partial [Rugosimonospora acidiphila]|uniref:carbohydrate-binding module family 20 domain-containing protein n=1 Tax=Rugosimonospora acidiphila TaxID=556531 RepID=UPI0031EE4BE1
IAAGPTRDVTANLFMWNWSSVATECTSVLGPDGYAAVQVAPPEDTLDTSGHPWWEIYQPVDYQLSGRMGSEAQFQSMVTTCHNAGVKVYVDAVINHAAAQTGRGTSYGGVPYTPSVSYPDYTAADFHNYPNDCPVSSNQISDWNNYQQVTECQLSNLPDLRTETTKVRGTLAGYLNKLIGYGVDGFRVDAAKHLGHADLAAIEALLAPDRLTGAPVYITQEVALGASNAQLQPASFENTGSLLGFDYADALKAQFTGSIANFGNFGSWSLLPSGYSSSFVNNHDTERDGSTLSYKDGTTYNLATEFLLAWGYGTPQVYSGFTFNGTDDSPPSGANGYVSNTTCGSGWYCTDRLTGVANLVAWHNLALANNDPVANWYSDGSNLIAFSRGSDAWIAINNESSAATRTFTTGLPDGTYCDLIHGNVSGPSCSGPTVAVSGGVASVGVAAKDAVAIDVNTRIGGAPTSPPPTGGSGVGERFTVTGAPTAAPIYLVGSIGALGNWAPASAIPMTRSGSTWSVTVDGLPAGTRVEYKYIERDAAGTVTWEPGGNHALTTAASGSASVTDTWNGSTGTDAITFNEYKTTVLGQNVYLVGSIPALGSWNTASALPLSSAGYPTWSVMVALPPSTAIEYKYIVRDGGGNVTWESGANRTYTTPPSGAATINDTWK